ncbi:MAG: alpha amylase N-terminal ig-like domain-containing protein [Phycisphaerae bacterium]|nr:alpha amylase N-terminal ig-like domain-containing protein [Phycisphaerae bacterium]
MNRYHRLTQAVALFVGVAAPLAVAAPPDVEQISLAGTFNDWATNDEACRLSKVGDRYELVRFWPCGSYEFKFVFNGSWGRHLGDAGGAEMATVDSDGQVLIPRSPEYVKWIRKQGVCRDYSSYPESPGKAFGELAQPGKNITLTIPVSLEYTIWLNMQANTWGLEIAMPSRFRPGIIIRDPAAATVELNTTLPTCRLGAWGRVAGGLENIRPFTCSWAVTRLDEDQQDWELQGREGAYHRRHLALKEPGRYEIRLSTTQGERVDEAKTVCRLGHGWELVRDAPVNDGLFGLRMVPLNDGIWGCVYYAAEDAEERFFVRSVLAADPRDAIVSATHACGADRKNLVKFDPDTRSLSFHDDGWCEFFCTDNKRSGLLRVDESTFHVERVELVGDFNGWQAGTNPMVCHERGVWRCILELPDGVYHYKFLVNGAIWLEDPNGDPRYREPDGRGGYNSGVLIGDDAQRYGPAKPDHIARGALKHDPTSTKYLAMIADRLAARRKVGGDCAQEPPSFPQEPPSFAQEPPTLVGGHAQTGRTATPRPRPGALDPNRRSPGAVLLVLLSVRTLAEDVEAVEVILNGRADSVPMRRVKSDFGFDYWSAQVLTEAGPLAYAFRLSDGSDRLVFGAGGVVTDGDASSHLFRPDVEMSFQTPDWAKTAVWYQIFPERFHNGDPSNDPPRTVPWTHEWFKPYTGASQASASDPRAPGRGRGARSNGAGSAFKEEGDFQSYIYDRRYGGDIQGIREKLPYLRQLGITAIYLNPVFQAVSLHKYDAADYRHIDDYFGVKGSIQKISGETADPATWQWTESDRVFLDFLKEAHRLGFKVIIDGVFNHTGREFWAFQDILKNKDKSPYADWFDIKSWEPFHYGGWDGDDGALPRLKHDEKLGLSEPVREHIFAVTRRWLDPDGDGDPSDGIDGWRLDVASDINAHFWRDWRKLVKSINPEAYIVAELWEESREWLTGDTFDAVMNYPFARSCQRFFVNKNKGINPAEFGRQLEEVLSWYPPQVNYVQQNLFNSHDTDRVASMFMNPDLEYDKANRLQDSNPNYNAAKPTPDCYDRLKPMVTLQMTFLGAPMFFYGDEVGMYGPDDPSCRKPMLWPELMPYDDPDERIEQDLYEHYRRMIAIRNSIPALQLGTYETLLAEMSRGIFAFSRTLGDETIVAVFNNSNRARKLDVPVPWSAGSAVLRLDDPAACEVVDPPVGDPTARPTLRPVDGYASPLKVVDGHLRGMTLGPRTAGVFQLAKRSG